MIPGLSVELTFARGGATIHGDHPARDYEYWLTVKRQNMPLFAAALGTTVDGIAAGWSRQADAIVEHGESTWLREHGVPFEFFSWAGMDADW